jgi:hypothetical protein
VRAINLKQLAARFWRSAVAWSWAFNGLRLLSGILLLPLLVAFPEKDLGFYYFLVSLSALAPLIDLGLVTALDRNVAYAAAGATEISTDKLPEIYDPSGTPNYLLLWRLLHTTRYIYGLLSVALLLVLGSWGTWVVYSRAPETSNPTYAWLAWAATLVCGIIEVYAGWWNVFLRGLNQVLLYSKLTFLSMVVRLILSYVLLSVGMGLLAVPAASLVSMALQRQLSRRFTLRLLGDPPRKAPDVHDRFVLLKILWPGSWRIGVHLISVYLATHANGLLCVKYLGLAANAQYGLSVQVIGFISSIAQVWLYVKWPLVAQLRAKNDSEGIRRLVRPRFWLHHATFWGMAMILLPVLPGIINLLSPGKSLLPWPWLLLLAIQFFMESKLSMWATLILTGNRMPFVWAFLVSNSISLLLAFALVQFTSLGAGALVLAPLLCGAVYNYWKWPRQGARSLQSSWTAFMFSNVPFKQPREVTI